ncbi:hypothetical protein B0J15DRAFT_460561 [Fusarium solani]|uniref:Uncharacterized protein n=1 Tax=Fusarium solani TaxID=169388 RepID=A0A9P9RCB4_FUSSL|nr:uncharacterized protein B0J15DRAFT_460561 [Fusarium solani]KAH7272830.1 hypothetical protein B0J15DRAFT_460561 [Fusarium solani]
MLATLVWALGPFQQPTLDMKNSVQSSTWWWSYGGRLRCCSLKTGSSTSNAPRHRGFGGLGRGKRSHGPTAVANEARAYREAASESQLTPPALERARYRGQGLTSRDDAGTNREREPQVLARVTVDHGPWPWMETHLQNDVPSMWMEADPWCRSSTRHWLAIPPLDGGAPHHQERKKTWKDHTSRAQCLQRSQAPAGPARQRPVGLAANYSGGAPEMDQGNSGPSARPTPLQRLLLPAPWSGLISVVVPCSFHLWPTPPTEIRPSLVLLSLPTQSSRAVS